MVTSIPFLIAKITDDTDFLKLKELTEIHDGWSLDYDKEKIKIWSKSIPDATVKMVKVWSIFSATPSVDLYDTLLDPIYRREWDPHIIVGYDIGHFNANNAVSYYAASCPPPLTSRDFVLQNSWLDRGAEYYVLNHSVCHKDHPPKKGFVRAISYITGYFIKCLDCNGCEMSFVSQTDPQGIIPSWIVNKCVQIFAPKFIRKLERAASVYRNWKTHNHPDLFPWKYPEQITSPQISLEDCIPSDEELKSRFFRYVVEKTSVLNPSSASNVAMLSSVSATNSSKISCETFEREPSNGKS